MKKAFVYIFMLLMGSYLNAQSTEKYVEDQMVFENEWSVGGMFHTRGWGIDFTKIKYKNARKKIVWQFGISEIKGPGEKKTQSLYNSSDVQFKGFFFGKQNKFYSLEATYGRQRTIAGKGRKGAVEIAWTYKGGISLGVAKPYYVLTYNEGDFIDVKYDGTNDDVFLNQYAVVAGSDFSKGFNEIKFYPGVVGRIGLIFDWASHQEFVKSIEVGFQSHIFYKRVPIMVPAENHFWHPNLYIKLNLGRRH